MSGTILAAAHPKGGAGHLVLLGAVVVIGLVVFAVIYWRRRHEQPTVDEVSMRELSIDRSRPSEQNRQPAESHRDPGGHEPHGHPAGQKHRARPH
jgi:hypothetical protein